nr:ribonuclease H-like domain-containing protein [Tanacetum cinerariifolium]
MTLKRFDYNDALGRSKSETCPIYLILRSSMVDVLPLEVIQMVVRFMEKNSVLFTDTEYLVLSSEFKLPDENQVLLRVPMENNMYNVNLKNIVPFGDLTCLFAKAIIDESNLWQRRLGHINFKTMNKLVKGNLVRGLPTKFFENETYVLLVRKASNIEPLGNPQHTLKDKGVIDSGCSRNMTGNMSYLSDFKELNGGCVAFGGNPNGGKIYGKGKIRIRKLDFDDVYFVKELNFNLFSV